MKSMLALFSGFVALTAFAPSAQAYFLAIPKSQGAINYSQPSRILVSGRGTSMGLQPQESALTTAKLYQMNFPNDQLVLLSVFEKVKDKNNVADNGETNRARLDKAGWVVLVDNDVIFNTDSAMAELVKFSRIRSLEFWGHNSAHLGLQTDGTGGDIPRRFDFSDPRMALLTPLFDRDAFASIHGCNGGWISAQEMAKLWNIPFSAALTETQFESLHSNGHFYLFDPKPEEMLKYAPDANWMTNNPDVNSLNCEDGGCTRMRPNIVRYAAKWGDFAGPFLNHYKFFCPLEQKECEKRMALSLWGFLAEKSLKRDSDFAHFQQVAKEYLCPISADPKTRQITKTCFEQLDLIAKGKGNRKIFFEKPQRYESEVMKKNPQLACDLKSCKAKIVCDSHSCKLSDRESKGSTTLADEYLHLLRGFKTLQAEGGL